MLKTIIAREFLNNILNLRFMIGLVLCIIVAIACIMILAHDYRQEMKDYNVRVICSAFRDDSPAEAAGTLSAAHRWHSRQQECGLF